MNYEKITVKLNNVVRKNLFLILLCIPILSNAQTTTITLPASKDAAIREYKGVGDGNNYGSVPFLNIQSWTNLGYTANQRSLIDFDLSMITGNATVNSAFLFLYVDVNVAPFPGGHQLLSGSNKSIIKRVIASWTEPLVTWNNQPGTTTFSQTNIPASISSNQNYIVDVTNLVQDMVNDPANSHGFLIRLINENYYRRMIFASKDNHKIELHPRLEITYVPDSTFTNIEENYIVADRSLVKVVDLFGKEVTPKQGGILFYIFNDGTVEKKIVIE